MEFHRWASELKPRWTRGSQVTQIGPAAWRLEVPAGPARQYRLAQLDDYSGLPRRKFPWQAPFRLELRGRASAKDIPGTWGFGLWNNPFGMGVHSLPVLPNTVWFFCASKENYLSLRDDYPAQGLLAATFSAPRWPAALFLPGGLFLPLLALRPVIRFARRVGRALVQQDGVAMQHDPTTWHRYTLEWTESQATLWLDGQVALQTTVAPRGPLGLVIWVDNQYAAALPDGRLRFGTLTNPEPAWIEIEALDS